MFRRQVAFGPPRPGESPGGKEALSPGGLTPGLEDGRAERGNLRRRGRRLGMGRRSEIPVLCAHMLFKVLLFSFLC